MNDQIAGRLTQLEHELLTVKRQNLRLRRFGVAFLIASVSLVAIGARRENERTIEAERIILRDRAGNARAVIGVDERNDVSFVMNDERGTARAVLFAKDGGAAFALNDQRGHRRVSMGITPTDNPAIVISTEEGHAQVSMTAHKEVGPRLTIHDMKGEAIRVSMGVWPNSHAYMAVLDEKGKTIWDSPKRPREAFNGE
jgi:hypothetical protein